jgi:plasmid stability protein
VANVLIKSLDELTVARLNARAARTHRSLQTELRTILERAAMTETIDTRLLAASSATGSTPSDRHHRR